MKRENSRRRRAPQRDELTTVLVVCGGKATEPGYFRGLKKAFRNPAVRVRVENKGVDPVSLVQHVSAKPETGDYDEVWCVVDVDQFELNAAAVAAKQAGINLAISNPCFEYWLLLHFESCRAPLLDYIDVARRLKKHLPDYDKAALQFRHFEAGVETAIANARSDTTGDEHTRNPSTGVWALVERIV